MKILAVDLGDVRTGLALCDSSETIASPLGCIVQKNMFKVSSEVARIANEKEAEVVVVVLPKNMDGSEGPRAKKCIKFSEVLARDVGDSIEVVLWDERITTVQAYKNLYDSNVHGKKTRSLIDSEAARLILENYIAFRKNTK